MRRQDRIGRDRTDYACWRNANSSSRCRNPREGTGVCDRCRRRKRLLGCICLPIAGARYPKGPGLLPPPTARALPTLAVKCMSSDGQSPVCITGGVFVMPAVAQVAYAAGGSDRFYRGMSCLGWLARAGAECRSRPHGTSGFHFRTVDRSGHVSTTQRHHWRSHRRSGAGLGCGNSACDSCAWGVMPIARSKPPTLSQWTRVRPRNACHGSAHLPPVPASWTWPSALSIRRMTICRRLVAMQQPVLTELPQPEGIMRLKGTQNVSGEQ